MSDKSWVIIEIATGKVIFETFNGNILNTINAEKYKAVPITEHLQSLNRQKP